MRVLLIAFIFVFSGPMVNAGPIGSYNIDEGQISVSGLSSGGYMAGQFHVAHSKRIMGAAILAAGPYYCASGSFRLALNRCTDDDQGRVEVPLERLIATTEQEASNGHIDPLSFLTQDRIWLYIAGQDNTVEEPVTDALVKYYQRFVDQGNIATKTIANAEHGFPTENQGLPCDVKGSPFINNCRFDGAKALLEHIYGPLKPKTKAKGALIQFQQKPFELAAMSSMGESGYVYVPTGCAQGERCKLHVSFHGCKQTENFIGRAYVTQTGYNEWAESNNIVMLYPQSKPSHQPFNPNGCWDWWGYRDAQYHRKSGQQISAVNNMIDRLLGKTN